MPEAILRLWPRESALPPAPHSAPPSTEIPLAAGQNHMCDEYGHSWRWASVLPILGAVTEMVVPEIPSGGCVKHNP